jgi:hypothetical protein
MHPKYPNDNPIPNLFVMPGERTASQLKSLIIKNQIQQIEVYRFTDAKLHNQSCVWSFGYEFLDVGGQPYNLNRILTFRVVNQVLQLYF